MQFNDRVNKWFDINPFANLGVSRIGFDIRKLEEMYEKEYRNPGAQPLSTVSLEPHTKDNATRSRRFSLRMALGLFEEKAVAVDSTARVTLSHSRRTVRQPECL
jgi:hypothetical protein